MTALLLDTHAAPTREASSLVALEARASEHLTVWKHAYWEFWTVLLEIRDTGVWEQSKLDTWEAYLESRWLPELEVSYNRIRQIQAAYPIMRLVHDVTNVTLNEGQVRNLKKVVPEQDRYLLPEIVSESFAYTSTPNERHFKAVYDTVKERQETNTVTVDGQSRKLNITSIAAKEAMVEADKRYMEHKTQGLIDVPVQVIAIDGKAYAVIQLPTDYPIALLKNWIAKVPKPAEKREVA